MKTVYPERPILCCSAYSDNRYIQSTFASSRHKPEAAIAKRRYRDGQVLDIVEGLIRKFPVERD